MSTLDRDSISEASTKSVSGKTQKRKRKEKEGDICLPKKWVYLEVWTGDALGQLFEERYHHFGELCRFYHI